jgi:hypothetical protein
MRKTLIRATRIAALAAATFAAIGAHAGTDTLYNGPVAVPSGNGFTTIDFTVTASSATFYEGVAIFNAEQEGLGILSGPGVTGGSQTFALTYTGEPLETPFVQHFDLTEPGAYTFKYDFANMDGSHGGLVALEVNVVSVPEPETLAMLLTGLLAVGVIARRTLRKSDSIGDAVAA